MAMAPNLAERASINRRAAARIDLNLSVTLRRPGTEEIIPAAIANISATGFLAEVLEGFTLPERLEVDLPQVGRREAEVVWTDGAMAGFAFVSPLGKPALSAARLKSEPRTISTGTGSAAAQQIADSVADLVDEATRDEKWPLRTRALVIAGASTLTWMSLVGIAALLL